MPWISVQRIAGILREVTMSYQRQARYFLTALLFTATAVNAQTTDPATPNIMIGNVVPGLTTTERKIRSMRELRYEGLTRQEQDFTCGAAALATVLQNVFGRKITEHEIIEDMLRNTDAKTVKERGFSLLDMKSYVERVGLRGRGYKIDQTSLLTLKIPVITLQITRGFPHFVVVKKVFSDTVFIADPSLGHRQVPLDEFLEGWNGIVFAVVGDGLQAENALIQSAKSMALDTRAGILTQALAPQREFGLLGMDAF